MCKFSNKLFAISVLLSLATHSTYGASLFEYIDAGLSGENNKADYDLTYDQRQNGSENLRLNIDGVLIAVPASSASSPAASSAFTDAASNILLTTLLGFDYDDKSADIPADESPIAAETDTKQKEPAPVATVEGEKSQEKKIEANIGETEVVSRNNAKSDKIAADDDDDEQVPKKIHLRSRSK